MYTRSNETLLKNTNESKDYKDIIEFSKLHCDYLLAMTLNTCICVSLVVYVSDFLSLKPFLGWMALVNSYCAFLLWSFFCFTKIVSLSLFDQDSLSSIWMSILVVFPITLKCMYTKYQICYTSLMDVYMYTHVYLWQGKSSSILSQLELLWFNLKLTPPHLLNLYSQKSCCKVSYSVLETWGQNASANCTLVASV